MVKLYFQHPYTPAASVTWSFRNHSNILIWCSRNISYYYQGWKQLCCLIFGEKCCDFFQDSLTNSVQKEQHLFETEIFYNIINVISIN